jgi:hypothetical protein
MEFDKSKVRSEWDNSLDGKKGWFSNFITDVSQINLQYYVLNEMKDSGGKIYGTCRRNNLDIDAFRIDGYDGHCFTYFYPDDREEKSMEFDKENLFIAGYNDEEVNIGDEGFVGISIDQIKNDIKNNKKAGGIIQSKTTGYFGLNNKSNTSYQMFYRTKCAPQKKYIPWMSHTAPDDLLLRTIISKVDPKTSAVITRVTSAGVDISGQYFSFSDLLDHWFLDKGTPCGQEVEE